MPAARLGSRVARQAPAKLNLFLQVLGRRADGYHEIVSVMQTLDLADRVEVELVPRAPDRPRVELLLDGPLAGPDLPRDRRNLAVAAALAVLEAAEAPDDLGLSIRLEKHVPAAGGLGGGSSDAAAVLRCVDELLGDPLGERGLHTLAAQLGSDVNVFLVGGTVLALGRGERVRAIAPPQDFEATLLLPPFGVSTPAVYAALHATPLPPDWSVSASEELGDDVAARVAGASSHTLQQLFRNDLEDAATRCEPRLGDLLHPPRRRLCGSGSSVLQLGAPTDDMPRACESKSIRFLQVRSRKR